MNMLDKVLNTAKDIVVVEKIKDGKFVFIFPFEGEIAEHYFDKTLVNPKENKINGFNRYWDFNDKTGLINGSSTLLTLRLDEKVRPDGFWVPTPEEGLFLDKNGKLSNNVYRDYGIAVYSENEPNKEIAKEIIKQVEKDLPLVIPFKALTYRIDEGFPDGVAVALVENPKGIKSGGEASELLKKFYTGNSGACGLDRNGGGYWDALWSYLALSSAAGRVDWMCG